MINKFRHGLHLGFAVMALSLGCDDDSDHGASNACQPTCFDGILITCQPDGTNAMENCMTKNMVCGQDSNGNPACVAENSTNPNPNPNPQTCGSREIYNVSKNACVCNTAKHWEGTAGNCKCSSGYKQNGDACLQFSVGDVVTLGRYEQDNNTNNGKEPITWRVLAIQDGKALLISEKVLDVKPFNLSYSSLNWDRSTIRSWLNGYDASFNTDGENFVADNFYDTAFTLEEQSKIVMSNVPAHENPEHSSGSLPGSATTDKIFLLSINEVQTYFRNDTDRKADATRYAVKAGAYVLGSSSVIDSDDGTCVDAQCYSYWWLRTSGDYNINASCVDYNGTINFRGGRVHYSDIAVRPAFWMQP